MAEKLTLSIEKEVIEQAKQYAKASGRSLSSLVETYLEALVKKNTSTESPSPRLQALSGVVHLPEIFDEKEALLDYLKEKHL